MKTMYRGQGAGLGERGKRTRKAPVTGEALETLKKKNMELADELNPDYLFQMTATELLSKIAKGEIDPDYYARRELANRGLDVNGKWIGFLKAAQEHKIDF